MSWEALLRASEMVECGRWGAYITPTCDGRWAVWDEWAGGPAFVHCFPTREAAQEAAWERVRARAAVA